MDEKFITGNVSTKAGSIPVVSTKLKCRDHWGTFKVRWGINREGYMVEPGLYGIGIPTKESPVLVSANYKLSFDKLRKELTGLNAWILVIDTKGINVWCAAGKGTFGTEEIINRIEKVDLKKVVTHNKIVVPQLGAPGIAAHIVEKKSGFTVVFGPVRAKDTIKFINNKMIADEKMRAVTFNFIERIVLAPVEFVSNFKFFLLINIFFWIVAGIHNGGFSFSLVLERAPLLSLGLGIAYFGGTVLAPALLPYLPGRAFYIKGISLAILLFAEMYYTVLQGSSVVLLIVFGSLMLSIVSYLTMNFTGSTTYTSLSGVQKEMKIALPIQMGSFSIGLILWIALCFIK